MNRPLYLRLSALFGVAALVVAACGGAPATQRPATQAPPASQAAPSQAAPSQAAPSQAAPSPTQAAQSCQDDDTRTPVEVQGWWTTGGEANGFNKIIAMFNEANPDICVYNAAIAGGAGTVAQGRIKAAVLAGLPPDTFQVHMGHELLDTYVNIEPEPVLSPLDDMFATNGWNDQFPADVLSIISDAEGHPYSVPLNIHRANVLWYNKSVFTANNLQPPTTWADFETAANTLKAAGVTPLAIGDSGIWANGMILETILIGTLGAEDFNGLWTGAVGWDDSRVTDALTEYAKILDPANGWINTDHSTLSWDQANDLVISGKAAMTIMGDWVNGDYVAKDFKDYGWAPAPGNAEIFQALSDSFPLPAKAAHPEEATKFLTWLGTATTQAIFNPYKGSIAANTTSGDPPASELQYNDYQKSAQTDWKENTIVPSMEHGAAANPAWSSQINDILTTFVTSLDVESAQADLADISQDFVTASNGGLASR